MRARISSERAREIVRKRVGGLRSVWIDEKEMIPQRLLLPHQWERKLEQCWKFMVIDQEWNQGRDRLVCISKWTGSVLFDDQIDL